DALLLAALLGGELLFRFLFLLGLLLFRRRLLGLRLALRSGLRLLRSDRLSRGGLLHLAGLGHASDCRIRRLDLDRLRLRRLRFAGLRLRRLRLAWLGLARLGLGRLVLLARLLALPLVLVLAVLLLLLVLEVHPRDAL